MQISRDAAVPAPIARRRAGRHRLPTPTIRVSARTCPTAVAHGDGDVSTQSQKSCAANGRAVEFALEFGLAQSRQPFQRWIDEFGARLKIGVYRDRPATLRPVERHSPRLPIPGAHVLADVAAENLPAHFPGELFGDWPLVLNGQIRDTPRRIHLVGNVERAGRAGLDAARATAATIGICSSPRGLAASLTSSDVKIAARNPNEPNFG